jgi:hypothetical protein
LSGTFDVRVAALYEVIGIDENGNNNRLDGAWGDSGGDSFDDRF